MNYKIKMIYFVVLLFVLSFAAPTTTKAVNISTHTPVSGSILYSYKSECANADNLPIQPQFLEPKLTSEIKNGEPVTVNFNGKIINTVKIHDFYAKGGSYNYLFSDRGIIVPQGLTEAKVIYVYWHGRGWWHHSPESMCNASGDSQLCATAPKLGNAVILTPHTLNVGSKNQILSTSEMKCFFDEALKILDTLKIKHDKANVVVTGHSAGGNYVEKFVNAGYTASKPIVASIDFDASYSPWAQTLVSHSNSGKVFIYYNDPAKTMADAIAAQKKAPEKTKVLRTYGIVHYQVPIKCFLDHLNNDLCQGIAKAPVTNQIATVDTGSGKYIPTAGTTGVGVISKLLTDDEVLKMMQKPQLKIHIPGLENFTDPSKFVITEETDKQGFTSKYLQIPYLGEYLAGVYKYAVSMAIAFAIVMIINQGFKITMSGGETDKISEAKKRLGEALIGLFIAISSYALLYLINPQLVEFKNLKVRFVQPEKLGEEDESTIVATISKPATYEDTHITSAGLCFPLKNKDSLGSTRSGDSNGISWNWGDCRGSKDCSKIPGNRCHGGIDIYTKSPGLVVAVDEGKVTNVMKNFISGGCTKGWSGQKDAGGIFIYHEKFGKTIFYGELDIDKIAPLKEGDKVAKGQTLGVAGACGMLHLQLFNGEKSIYESWKPKNNSGIYGQNKCAKESLDTRPSGMLDPTQLISDLQNKFCS